MPTVASQRFKLVIWPGQRVFVAEDDMRARRSCRQQQLSCTVADGAVYHNHSVGASSREDRLLQHILPVR